MLVAGLASCAGSDGSTRRDESAPVAAGRVLSDVFDPPTPIDSGPRGGSGKAPDRAAAPTTGPASAVSGPAPSDLAARIRAAEQIDAAALERSGRLGPGAAAVVARGRRLVDEQRFFEAYEWLRAAALSAPADPLLQFELGRIALLCDDPVAAEKALDRTVELGGLHPDLRRLRGAVALRIGGDRQAEGEVLLRAELAEGEVAPAVDAALELAAWLAREELHGEALAVLDAGSARAPGDPRLGAARARVLRDLARFDMAADQARRVLEIRPQDLGALRLLIECERSAGRPEVALQLIGQQTVQPSVPGGETAFTDLREELERQLAGGRRVCTPAELLAQVRGGAELSERLAALRPLLAEPATRERAAVVGFAQDEPVLRVTVVGALPADHPAFAERLELAAEDPAAVVRGAAARRVPEIVQQNRAIRLLRRMLDAEEDDYVFRLVHEALTSCLGRRVDLLPEAEQDPETRERVRREWRQACPD